MTSIHGFGVIALMALLLTGGAVEPAGATTIQVPSADLLNPPSFTGNDCSGVFGIAFANCDIPASIDPDESPIIIKFNFNDGVPGAVEINSGLFPTIDGSEIALGFDNPTGITGTWTYTPGAGDPGITFWVAKGGAFFNLFTDDSGASVTTGTWVTPLTALGGNPTALSHIDFYDTTGTPVPVPEPGSLVLVGVGLLGGAWLARRKRR
jgi:hypothetical protein